MNCNSTFQIDLAPIGIPIGAKSIGNWYLRSKFGYRTTAGRMHGLNVLELVMQQIFGAKSTMGFLQCGASRRQEAQLRIP